MAHHWLPWCYSMSENDWEKHGKTWPYAVSRNKGKAALQHLPQTPSHVAVKHLVQEAACWASWVPGAGIRSTSSNTRLRAKWHRTSQGKSSLAMRFIVFQQAPTSQQRDAMSKGNPLPIRNQKLQAFLNDFGMSFQRQFHC